MDKQIKEGVPHPKRMLRLVYKFILISISVHVVGLLIFGGFIVFERLQPEPVQFEQPVNLNRVEPKKREYKMRVKEQQSRSSRPKVQPRLQSIRPAPLALPSIDTKITPAKTDISDLPGLSDGLGEGLGFGGGNSMEINFFGALASGNSFAILLDLTLSGGQVFEQTMAELLKTLKAVKEGNANYMLIYFGGRDAGHMPKGSNNSKDFTKSDYWYPKGISGRKWLSGSGSEMDKIIKELNSVTFDNKSSWTGSADEMDKGGVFFRAGTQYWGALHSALGLSPAPSTVFLMVEPRIGLPNEQTVQANWEWYQKHGRDRPESTQVHLIVGKPEDKTNVAAAELMVNLLNGGNLRKSQMRKLLTYVDL